MQKRLLTIQDYSCLGRCSLTVALPTISACGIECVGLPTAILSNHTQYESWTFKDLTDDLKEIISKWRRYNHTFDCIYTGYLATSQIGIVKDIISLLRTKNTIIYVDPAMADNGELYKGFGKDHVSKMAQLFKLADYVKPNVTEACLLTNTPYPTELMPLSFYEKLIKDVKALGPKNVVLTGIKLEKGKIGVLILEDKKEESSYMEFDYLKAYFHGTGDLFSSALSSMLTLGKEMKESIEIAHNYVVESMKAALDDKLDGMLYGPSFEKAIPLLIKNL